jgi:hypothetical protein
VGCAFNRAQMSAKQHKKLMVLLIFLIALFIGEGLFDLLVYNRLSRFLLYVD